MKPVKQIHTKNRTYYFFNYMINIEDFDSNLLKIDKKSYKNIGTYFIGYITIKKIDEYENKKFRKNKLDFAMELKMKLRQ